MPQGGTQWQAHHDYVVWGLTPKQVECDDIWTFCYAKEHNAPTAGCIIDGAGDIWTWTALARDSNLLITWPSEAAGSARPSSSWTT